MSAPSFVAAFDRALAAVDRAQSGGMRTLTGASAGPMLTKLRVDLVAERDAALARGHVDPEWIRASVRSVAEWTPTDEVKLLAVLGAIARSSPRPPG